MKLIFILESPGFDKNTFSSLTLNPESFIFVLFLPLSISFVIKADYLHGLLLYHAVVLIWRWIMLFLLVLWYCEDARSVGP